MPPYGRGCLRKKFPIVTSLPPFVVPISLFVNEQAETVRQLIDACGLALAPLHGDEPCLIYCETLGRPAIKAFGSRTAIHGLPWLNFMDERECEGSWSTTSLSKPMAAPAGLSIGRLRRKSHERHRYSWPEG